MNMTSCVNQTSDNLNPFSVNDPVYKAIKKGDLELLKTLLNMATINGIKNESLMKISALDLAVDLGNAEATKLLLDHGAIPDYKRPMPTWLESTLGRAIRSDNHDIIKMLIDKGCNPESALDRDGQRGIPSISTYNCWYNVVRLQDFSIFQLLLECTGQEVGDNEWSKKMLLTACDSGSDEIVSYLLDQGVPIDSVDSKGRTGAFYAVNIGDTDTLQLLSARGANLNHKDNEGRSLLHLAISNRLETEWIRLLLDLGLDVNSRDMFQRTPLHLAVAIYDQVEMIKLLLERGAEINARDELSRTPLITALVNEVIDYRNVRFLLQQKNIDLVQPDYQGLTVLHLVSLKRVYPDVREVLLRPEVNINARDSTGKTPLEYIIMTRNFSNLALYLDLGANTNVLLNFIENLRKNNAVMEILMRQTIKRMAAGLNEDLNIKAVLDGQEEILKESIAIKMYIETCSKEIQEMKTSPLFGNMTYFNFLRAKRRDCLATVSRSGKGEECLIYNHNFNEYRDMLTKKYICEWIPVTDIEIKAFQCAEANLDIVFNNCLTSLVVYKIIEYLEIDDMITLNKLLNNVDAESATE